MFTYTNSRAIPPFPTTTILSAWAKFFWKAWIKKGKMSFRACSLTLINYILFSILVLIFSDYWGENFSISLTISNSFLYKKEKLHRTKREQKINPSVAFHCTKLPFVPGITHTPSQGNFYCSLLPVYIFQLDSAWRVKKHCLFHIIMLEIMYISYL